MIRAICLDDKNKPESIPDDLWVKEQGNYTITHILKQVREENGEIVPTGVIGVHLKELDISAYIPYTMFNISRFGINAEDMDEFLKMCEETADLNNADISELTELLFPEYA